MIELIVLDYLKNIFTDIPVVMESTTDDEYILIEKTSGGIDTFIETATFAIQSYSDSLYNAASLNERVKAALLGDGSSDYGIVAIDGVCKCTLNSDYNYSDTITKKYRYQAVFDITVQ